VETDLAYSASRSETSLRRAVPRERPGGIDCRPSGLVCRLSQTTSPTGCPQSSSGSIRPRRIWRRPFREESARRSDCGPTQRPSMPTHRFGSNLASDRLRKIGQESTRVWPALHLTIHRTRTTILSVQHRQNFKGLHVRELVFEGRSRRLDLPAIHFPTYLYNQVFATGKEVIDRRLLHSNLGCDFAESKGCLTRSRNHLHGGVDQSLTGIQQLNRRAEVTNRRQSTPLPDRPTESQNLFQRDAEAISAMKRTLVPGLRSRPL